MTTGKYLKLTSFRSRRLSFFFSTPEQYTRADLHRFENFFWGIEEFLKSPWIGYGLGSFGKNSPSGLVAHNTYLSITYEFGLLGICAFILIILANIIPLLQLRLAEEDYPTSFVTLLKLDRIPLLEIFLRLFFSPWDCR